MQLSLLIHNSGIQSVTLPGMINRSLRRIFSYFSIFLLTTGIMAQIEAPVTVEARIEQEQIRAGEVLTVLITATSEPDFKIYAVNDIAEGPIPSEVIIEGDMVDVVGETREPPPTNKYDEGFMRETYFHDGTVTFETDVRIKAHLDPGDYTLSAGLLFQACDPTICFPPTTKTFDLTFMVVDGPARPDRSEIVVAQAKSFVLPSDDDNIDLDNVISAGLGSFLLLSISMGLLALLTPCVFPMIPITVSYFTKLGETEGKSPLKQSLVYSIGIIVAYTVLGLILAATLGASGANQLASNPWVNLFIASLFVYFALSLFGMYEIELPASLRQFSLKQEGRGGYVGTLFMALTFTLTSFTCTVQFVGLLLVRAIQGDWIWPFIGMLFFSAAFALPFFFLALFPQYLSKLPKSGGWLNSVKVSMGFLELAAAFKFFSNTDLVWGWDVFTRPFVLATWVVIVFLTGLYLIGKIRLPHDSELATVGVPRLMLSIMLFSFALYMGRGLFGQPIHGLIDSYLPPAARAESGSIADEGSQHSGLKWILDYDEGIAMSEMTGKPMFVNFTGYTCTNCRWMETNVLVLSDVVSRLENYILIELFTDSGPRRMEYQKIEIDRFGTAALPFYVILSPDSEEIARFPGLTRDTRKFIQFLDKGLTGPQRLSAAN